MTNIRVGSYALLLLLMCSCRCNQRFYADNGRAWKKDGKLYRFTDIMEQDFILSVNQYDTEIRFNILTKFNAPGFVRERGVKVNFRQLIPVLGNRVELIRHERESQIGYANVALKQRSKDEYYTCENFHKEIKRTNKMSLKVVYDLDSGGTTRTIEKTYALFRKRSCYFAVH